jgi:hypothetical protein
MWRLAEPQQSKKLRMLLALACFVEVLLLPTTGITCDNSLLVVNA